MKRLSPMLKALNFSRIAAFVLAVVSVPAFISAAADISGLLARKGPRATEVVTKPTISRTSSLARLPVTMRQYEFLIDHPRLSIVLARLCDPYLDMYKIDLRPDGLMHVTDPAGLAGDVELISSSRGRRVYFIEGYYDLLRIRFNGRMVLMTEYSERPTEEKTAIDSTAVSYIKIDSAVAGVFAKMAAFLFPKKVDARIGRFTNAVRSVAIAVHNDPAGMYRKLAASGEAGPEELKEFAGMFLRKSGQQTPYPY